MFIFATAILIKRENAKTRDVKKQRSERQLTKQVADMLRVSHSIVKSVLKSKYVTFCM